MGKIIDSRPSPRNMHRLRWWGRLTFDRQDETTVREVVEAASNEHTLKIVADNLDNTVRATWEYVTRGASRDEPARLLEARGLIVHDAEEVPRNESSWGQPDDDRPAVQKGEVYLSPRGHTKKLCACPGRGAFQCVELEAAPEDDLGDLVLGNLMPTEMKTMVSTQKCTCGCGVQLIDRIAWRGPAASGWVLPDCYVRLARERMAAR